MATNAATAQAVERPLTVQSVLTDHAEEAVRTLIKYAGQDAMTPGMVNTPMRVAKAILEMTTGYRCDPAEILATAFDNEQYDEVIAVRGVRFTSLCEHHMMPFSGEATVAYLPGKKVVGLSKLARLVECFAKRFQLQERLTKQVADAVMAHTDAKGAACIVAARHSCMGCRGARQPDAEMVTSSMLGAFRDKPTLRAELLGVTG